MGLDMHLYKRVYIGNQHTKNKNEQLAISLPKNQDKRFFKIKEGDINQDKISYIIEEIMYWRKANSIHNWFVDNVQGGNADYGEYYVSSEIIERLVKECKEDVEYLKSLEYTDVGHIYSFDKEEEVEYGIYGNVDESKLNLVTTRGFFFGSTEYSELYVRMLEDTIQKLEPAIGSEHDFYYTSSW